MKMLGIHNNIALYKKRTGIYFQLLKKYVLPPSLLSKPSIEYAQKVVFSIQPTTGTLTIPIQVSVKGKLLASTNEHVRGDSATLSKHMSNLLSIDELCNCVDMIGKTYYQGVFANVIIHDLASKEIYSTTTGFTFETCTFLIPETHEKREYLGEFSLTHEEIQLQYLRKGGEGMCY